MDLKLLKMLCKDSKQHHVIFHELYSVSSLLCIAQNVRFEIPYKDLYFETPFLMIFKYYAWASYGSRPVFVGSRRFAFFSIAKYCAVLRNFSLFLPLPATLGIPLPSHSSPACRTLPALFSSGLPPPCPPPPCKTSHTFENLF